MDISRFHYGMSGGLCRALNVSCITYRINIPFPLLSLPFLLSLSFSLFVFLRMSVNTHGNSSSTQIIVGAHYRVGKKIGEDSFRVGVIFEGPSPPSLHQLPELYLTCLHILGVNLLNSQSVAIKFVSDVLLLLLRGPFPPF